MIEKTDSGITASCDTCSTETELQTHDFKFAVEVIKHRGWKITQKDGEWRHQCPCCVEDKKVLE